MADIQKTLPILYKAEYDANSSQALHQAQGESFLTYKGLQERDDPDFTGWKKIHAVLESYKGNIKMASTALAANSILEKTVQEYYKNRYWNPCHLDDVVEQHKADEMFLAAVLYSPAQAIRIAQKVIGVTADGIMGAQTLAALNAFDGLVFNKEYDEGEIDRAKMLVSRNPKLAINLKGWIARAKLV